MRSKSQSLGRASLFVTVALALTLAACGGPSATITLQVAPDSITVLLGGSAQATATLARSGEAAADVALSATGAPDWITVTFSPATLSGSTLESTMTITSDAGDPDAEETTFQLTVRAVGPGLNAQDTVTVEVERLDVNGTVLDGFGGPVEGATVHLAGRPAVTTGEDGSFTFAAVSAPYDLTVADTGVGIAHTYVGLTVSEPRLQSIGALISGSTLESETIVSGTLAHAAFVPVPANHRVEVCVEGVDRFALGCDTVIEGESDYEIENAGWRGSPTASVRVRAVLVETDAAGNPASIKAQAVSGVETLTDGAPAVVDLTLANTASQASVTLTAVPPSGFSLASYGLVSHYTERASFGIGGFDPSPATTFPVIAPFFAGASHTAFATAFSNAPDSASQSIAWSIDHGSGDAVTLSLPSPPTLVAPADTATGVTTETEFTLVNPSGGLTTLLFQPDASGPVYAVTTAETTAHLPALGSIGLALPAGADYTWAAVATHHLTDVDEAVTTSGFFGGFFELSSALEGAGPGPTTAGRISTTDFREFTTQ